MVSMFDVKEIYNAYLACRLEKRSSPDALLFEMNQEEEILRLADELNKKTYLPSTSVCFYLNKPKSREIFAAHFRDRIVHHIIYSRLAPTWEKIFIDQSFACRPEKGTHKGAGVLQDYCRKITKSGKQKAYYLKLDVANFFMSIDKNILYKILARKCSDSELLWLIHVSLFHDPTTDVMNIGRASYAGKLPPHKSLFNAKPHCGLPIGNLTSQFFANVYLNELDQYAKHVLKCHYYLRYVDDFVLLSISKGQLLQWKVDIVQFLWQRLHLDLNPEATKLDGIFHGVDFCGYIVRPFYMLVRRRVVGNLKSKLDDVYPKLVYKTTDRIMYYYDTKVLERLLATLNSYLGHFSPVSYTHLRAHET